MHLKTFDNSGFQRGSGLVKEALWVAISSMFISSWLPGSAWRVAILRAFGAKIGTGVVLKPRVRIKFPWRLVIKDDVWIGESVWIDNLDVVDIGSNVCISQGAYLCTGSHDWVRSDFKLLTRPIVLEDHVWICAKANLGPGTIVKEGSIVSFGVTLTGQLECWTIMKSTGKAPRASS